MGVQELEGLLAIHSSMPGTVPANPRHPTSRLTSDARGEHLLTTYKQVDYARIMGSRPQTLYAIADSPVGLAAWLLDHGGW
jgi:hypothetical protein